MKRILLIGMALLFGLSMQAQFKMGINGGMPTGTLSEAYSFNFGVDMYYYFVGGDDELLNIGATAGYQHFVGDDLTIGTITEKFPAAQFLPLAGAVRINIIEIIAFGTDIGYGLALSDDTDSGFYWRVVGGLDFGALELNAFFYNIAIDENFNQGSVGIGLVYDFGGD